MTTLQEIHKNVLWHGHEFEACLNRAINICKDADDWEKLLVFVVRFLEHLVNIVEYLFTTDIVN